MSGYRCEPGRGSEVFSQRVFQEVKQLQEGAKLLNSEGLSLEIVKAIQAIKAEISALDINELKSSKFGSFTATSD